jgi:hypothetical protein
MCPLLAPPHPKLFFLFMLRPFTVLMRQTRQAVRAIKQSISLDVYALFILVEYAFFNAPTPFWTAVKDSITNHFNQLNKSATNLIGLLLVKLGSIEHN